MMLIESSLGLPFVLFLFILPFPGTVSLRLLCLAAAFLLALAYSRRWSPPSVPCKPSILAWVLVTAASVAYSFDWAYSMGEFKNEILYSLAAYWAFFVFVRGERELRALLIGLGAAVAVVAVWGVADTVYEGIWVEDAGHGGSAAISAFLAAAAPLFATALFARPNRPVRLALWAVLVLIVLTAIITRQRILWPVFLIETALGAALLQRVGLVRWSARAGLSGASVAVLVAALGFVGVQQWREYTHESRTIEADARLSVWPKAVDRIMERPWRGAGLGRQAMRKAYPDLLPPQDTLVWHAHNIFLNAGISMGLPGVAALLLLFGNFYLEYARLAHAPERLAQIVGIAGILMLTGVIGRNLTNDFFVRDGSLLFWAINGALLGAGLRARSKSANAIAGRQIAR